MAVELDRGFIEKAAGGTIWDIGNQTLYDLCSHYPGHADDQAIAAKTCLIGRTYAATLERRGKGYEAENLGDDFYAKVIIPKMKGSEIDRWFADFGNSELRSVEMVLELHKNLMALFKEISGQDKRSLASKYLHFHFPSDFYIYDSRASNVLRYLSDHEAKNFVGAKFDEKYAKLFQQCEALNEKFRGTLGRRLSKRELDNVLLACFDVYGADGPPRQNPRANY